MSVHVDFVENLPQLSRALAPRVVHLPQRKAKREGRKRGREGGRRGLGFRVQGLGWCVQGTSAQLVQGVVGGGHGGKLSTCLAGGRRLKGRVRRGWDRERGGRQGQGQVGEGQRGGRWGGTRCDGAEGAEGGPVPG